MSFAVISKKLEALYEMYSKWPIRLQPPVAQRDPLQLTEADIRNQPIWRAGPKENPLMTDQLVDEWCGSAGLARGELYDLIAIWLARGFQWSYLDFSFCDLIVNELHGIIIMKKEDRPKVFWQVFLAFDAGESTHRSKTPVETFTRPAIAALVERYSHEYRDMSMAPRTNESRGS
jgi:hypothetical protein